MITLLSHPDCQKHSNGPGHPESPARLAAIEELFERELPAGSWKQAPAVSESDLLLAHTPKYLQYLRTIEAAGGGWLDPDTAMGPDSMSAALHAAGAVVDAAERALRGEGPAFCATRPPGHHATPSRAMGFCIFSSVAIAAFAAIRRMGAERVLIVDWDVHHGNGTADCVRQEPRIRYVSIHQWPYYPGTGLADDTGCGNLFNVPRPPGLPPGIYVRDLLDAVDRAVVDFAPSLVIHSAGFDAMRGDPLGGFTLEPEHYGEITGGIAERSSFAPAIGALEGGYDPARLAQGALEHVRALAGAGRGGMLGG